MVVDVAARLPPSLQHEPELAIERDLAPLAAFGDLEANDTAIKIDVLPLKVHQLPAPHGAERLTEVTRLPPEADRLLDFGLRGQELLESDAQRQSRLRLVQCRESGRALAGDRPWRLGR